MECAHVPDLIPKAAVGPRQSVAAEDLKDVLRSIYQNRYFTNHGPLAQEFERQLENYLDITNVVTVGNESLALLIAVAGLEVTGELVLPAYRGAIASSIADWLGLTAVYCDVDAVSHQVSVESISPVLTERTAAAILVETWGNRCDQQLVQFLTNMNVKVIVVAFESFASESEQRYVINNPQVTTVHAFGPDQLLTTLQGGAVATEDDELAHRFRNIRSSYGVREALRVKATCNGRFSELQAGLGIKSLQRLEERRHHFRSLGSAYRATLAGCPGINVYRFNHTQGANGQCFPIRIEDIFPLSRDELITELGLDRATASGAEYLGRSPTGTGTIVPDSFPVASRLSAQILQLPMHDHLDAAAATQLAEQIRRIR